MKLKICTFCSGTTLHRGSKWLTAAYKANRDGWYIDGIEYTVMRLEPKQPFFLVPASTVDECRVEDIGPFPNRIAAVMAATLMENS